MATTKVRGELVDLNEATSESGLKIPTGTELNRPATDVAGMIRNNTNEASEGSASCEEYYNGTEWKKINNVAIPPIVGMSTLIYSGNGSTQSLTGLGFKPDLVWIKNRNGTNPNGLWDSTRGAGKLLVSNTDAAESGNAGDLMGSFDADGFQVNRQYLTNTAYDNTNWGAGTYVGWAWKANGGTTSSNTDGDITSTVQANTEAGFSIITYQTNGSNSARVGHGLGTTPKIVLIKKYGSTSAWHFMTTQIDGSFDDLILNTDAVKSDSGLTAPTSTTFAAESGSSGEDMICYAFAEISGYSKFGTYTGTGSAGNAQSIGFQPDFILGKSYDNTEDWFIVDSTRGGNNYLKPNLSNAEATAGASITFTSTGFEFTGGSFNNAGMNFIYMAFLTA